MALDVGKAGGGQVGKLFGEGAVFVIGIGTGLAGHIVELAREAQSLAALINPLLPELVLPFGEGGMIGQRDIHVHEPPARFQMTEGCGEERTARLAVEMVNGKGGDDEVETPQRRGVPYHTIEALLHVANVGALGEATPGRVEHFDRAIHESGCERRRFTQKLIRKNAVATAKRTGLLRRREVQRVLDTIDHDR